MANKWTTGLRRLWNGSAGDDRRRNPRVKASLRAMVATKECSFRVRITDATARGMGAESKRPLEAGTLVLLKVRDLRMAGFADVRHCRRGWWGRYVLGLEFRGPLTPDVGNAQWEHQHLLGAHIWNEPEL